MGRTPGKDSQTHRHLTPVPPTNSSVRPVISAPYLRRLGWWVYRQREDAQESRMTLVEAMQHAGLSFTDKTLRTLEGYRTLPEDADVSNVTINLALVKFLAEHYNSTLAKLDAYCDGAAEAQNSDQETLSKLYGQMDPGRRAALLDFAGWLMRSETVTSALSFTGRASTDHDDALRRVYAEKMIEQAQEQDEEHQPGVSQNGTTSGE